MATNPMQKKARMYGLLGALITLVITGVIIAFLAMQLMNMKKEEASYKSVWVLTTDIKSGTELGSNLKQVKVPLAAAPSDAISAISTTAIAKINLSAGTTVTETMITEPDEGASKDLRLTEYNMIVLPSQLEVDDYIDIRLQLPNGQNFIVISKKRVIDANAETIWMNLNEYEILTMSSAIVEAYMMTGSKLYAVSYTDAGNQEQATGTYYPSSTVVELINSDPNITKKATEGLNANIRNGSYQNMINQYQESGLQNIESGITEEITKSIEARQKYVDGL